MTSGSIADRINDFVENTDMEGLEAVYNAIYPDAQVKFNAETNEFDELAFEVEGK